MLLFRHEDFSPHDREVQACGVPHSCHKLLPGSRLQKILAYCSELIATRSSIIQWLSTLEVQTNVCAD